MAKKNINFNTYVERDLDKTTVDWGTVANKLTGDLLQIREDRAAEREKIAQDTIDASDRVNEMEDYTSQTLQNLALGMSGDSAEFLRVQQNLFDRGLITQTQFAQNKQRVLGDWQQFGNISKRWESDYATMVKRADDGDASSFEVWLNKQNAEFGNLKNVKGYVNPDTGTLSLLRPNEDGTVSTDPTRHVSMNALQNRFNTQIQNVTKDGALDASLNASVDQLGALIVSKATSRRDDDNKIVRDGGVISREGHAQIVNSPDVQEYILGTVNSYLSNDNKTMSVLGDLIGGYEPTFDPAIAAADPTKVLMEYDSATDMATPATTAPNWAEYNEDGKLVGGQKFEAQQAVKNRMIMMLDDKSTVKPGQQPISEYQKLMAEIARDKLNLQSDTLNPKDDAIKMMGPNYSQNRNEKFGDDSDKSVYSYIDENLDATTAGNTDNEIAEVFKNSITGVFDTNTLNKLADGEYENVKYIDSQGVEQTYNGQGLDFQMIDEGPDYLRITFGDQTITYPPIDDITYVDEEGVEVTVPGIGEKGQKFRDKKQDQRASSFRGSNYNSTNEIFNYLRYVLIEPQYNILKQISSEAGELD